MLNKHVDSDLSLALTHQEKLIPVHFLASYESMQFRGLTLIWWFLIIISKIVLGNEIIIIFILKDIPCF